MEARDYVSVEIIHLNSLPSKVLSREVGTRRKGALGIMKTIPVAGFDSDAFYVEHRDPFGEKNGGWGIYFPGEYKIIPDLLSL